MSMQLERSPVESNGFSRRLEETARILIVITDELWTRSSSSLQAELGGHEASSKGEQKGQLKVDESWEFTEKFAC